MKWALCAVLAALLGCQVTGAASGRLSPREEAQVLLGRGDGAKALPILTRLHAADRADLGLARMVAEAHVKAGSAEAFLASLAPDDSAISHYQQGLVRFSKAADASAPAIAEFRRAAELAPEQAEFRYRLGVALLESEQYEQARLELEAAVTQGAEHPSWALALAKARYRTGDSKGATEAIRAVVLSSPTDGDVKTARALMDQVADPLRWLSARSACLSSSRPSQWLEVADVPQQAIVVLEEVLREHPEEAILHALLGLAWARLDDAGRGVDELKRAIELAPPTTARTTCTSPSCTKPGSVQRTRRSTTVGRWRRTRCWSRHGSSSVTRPSSSRTS